MAVVGDLRVHERHAGCLRRGRQWRRYSGRCWRRGQSSGLGSHKRREPGAASAAQCGNESAFEFNVKPFLRAQGVTALPRLVLSHGDLRNVGGTTLLRQTFSVSEINLSPVPFRSPTYRKLRDQLARTPGLMKTIRRNDQVGS